MKVQAYNEGNMSIFDKNGFLCNMDVKPPLKQVADAQIKRLGLRRISAWKDRQWGSECEIRKG